MRRARQKWCGSIAGPESRCRCRSRCGRCSRLLECRDEFLADRSRMSAPLWRPSPDRVAHANLTAFAAQASAKHGAKLPDYTALYRWSVEESASFWRELWDYGGVVGEPGARTLVDGGKMPGARWFPDARLNFAENLLARSSANDRADAFVFWGEDKIKRRVSHGELRAEVSRVAQA